MIICNDDIMLIRSNNKELIEELLNENCYINNIAYIFDYEKIEYEYILGTYKDEYFNKLLNKYELIYNTEVEEVESIKEIDKYIKKVDENLYNFYNHIIYELMCNDRNGSYDELLTDNDYDIEKSINDLKEILIRITTEELDSEGDKEEYEFYNNILQQINDFKNI